MHAGKKIFGNQWIKRWYIKICRYVCSKKYLSVFSGALKGYKWSTAYSYEYLLGNYEDEKVLKQFLFWCKPGTVFYDIGANIGFYSFLANTIICEGKIFSFEPAKDNIEVFKQHMQKNAQKIKIQNITLLPFAIADTKKEVIFSNNPLFADGNTFMDSSSVFQTAKIKEPVQAYSIDGLIEDGYPAPDMIKIDVEGAEMEVLKGAEKAIGKYKPNILIATHDFHVPGIKQNCIQFLEQLGYVLVYTGNYNKNMDGLDDFFAVHKSRQDTLLTK